MKFCISFDSASERNLVVRVGVVTLLVEHLSSTLEALGSAFLCIKPEERVHICDPCTQKVEARKSGVQGHLWLHKERKEGVREKKKEKESCGF